MARARELSARFIRGRVRQLCLWGRLRLRTGVLVTAYLAPRLSRFFALCVCVILLFKMVP